MRLNKTTSRKEWVNVENIATDPKYQRVLDMRRAQKIADNLDPDGLGMLTLSRRKDGSLVVVDGQHRVEALRLAGYGDASIQCEVFDELSVKEEASIFGLRNSTKIPRPLDKWKARVVARDSIAIEIEKLCALLGLRIAAGGGDGAISCVTTLERIYRGRNCATKPKDLERVLRIAINAWGRDCRAALSSQVVGGLGLIIEKHNKALDDHRMGSALGRHGGRADGVIGEARARARIAGSVVKNAANTMLDIYNKGLRGESRLAHIGE